MRGAFKPPERFADAVSQEEGARVMTFLIKIRVLKFPLVDLLRVVAARSPEEVMR
ncbi:MAG: hypothetical protein ACE5LX_01295 [Nitrospinota bacterium]